jgi:hypothetical protein
VTIVQRFDSALRLYVHPHTLVIDGVYLQDGDSDQLVFVPLPAPTHAEVATVAGRIAERAEAVMRKHGRWVDSDSADSELDPLSLEQPVLSACYLVTESEAIKRAEQGLGFHTAALRRRYRVDNCMIQIDIGRRAGPRSPKSLVATHRCDRLRLKNALCPRI